MGEIIPLVDVLRWIQIPISIACICLSIYTIVLCRRTLRRLREDATRDGDR